MDGFFFLFFLNTFAVRERDAIDSVHQYNNRLRFRKRDKMLFYGRRMLRKVKTLSGQAYNGQGRKRRAVMRFAKRILYLRRDDTLPMQLKTVEPPAEYLEIAADGSDRVPPDAYCMLQGIRIFGHFEKPIFLKMCKYTEIITLNTNELLFKIGTLLRRLCDGTPFLWVRNSILFIFPIKVMSMTVCSLYSPDYWMCLSITTTAVRYHWSMWNAVNRLHRCSVSLMSLPWVFHTNWWPIDATLQFHLILLSVSQGNESFYKSVTAKALEPSQVIRLPMKALKDIFDENPDILVRVVQVIMIRLQRVIFTALRNYLGLNSELVQARPHKDKRMSMAQVVTMAPTATSATSSSITITAPSAAAATSISLNKGSPTHYKRFESGFIHTLSGESNDLSRPDMLNDLSEHSLPKHNRRLSVVGERDPDVTTLYAFAIDGFLRELGLKESDRHLLEERVEFQEAESGITLLREGSEDVSTWK